MQDEAAGATVQEHGGNGKMDNAPKIRSTVDKVRLFRRCFTGLNNVYGTYDPASGKVRQVKAPVTDQVILNHLQGRTPYGVYLLVEDRTGAVVADFDADDLADPMEFVAATKRYRISAYIERSKRKGYHVWIFFEEGGVLAAKARVIVQHVLAEINRPHTEVFPKQDSLDGRVSYGNFINAPLFGSLVAQRRTVFLEPSDPTKPCENQWDFLEQIQRVEESQLDEIIVVNDLKRPSPSVPDSAPVRTAKGSDWFSLPPCVRRILAEGVCAFQRVLCFRLAVHLKKTGLPGDLAVVLLKAWALRNRPADGKRIITEAEIVDQVGWAYDGGYRSCGCEDPAVAPYCSPECPLRLALGQRGERVSPPRRSVTPAAGNPVSRACS